MNVSIEFTNDDRLAVLAACTTLGIERGTDVKPLGAVTWSDVAIWLNDQGMQPAALLEPGLEFDQLKLKQNQDKANAIRMLSTVPGRASSTALELEELEHRDIWHILKFDEDYPKQWKERLRKHAPPVMFGVGPTRMLKEPGIAIVGSREITNDLRETASVFGSRIAQTGRTVISGGAKGVDGEGMAGGLNRGGHAVGILSGDLFRVTRRSDFRPFVEERQLTLVSHVHPSTGFDAGNAMTRNGYIHTLAEAVIVVSTTEGKGGTWDGAVKNLKNRWSPLLVWMGEGAPAANQALVVEGGYSVTDMPENGDALLELIESARQRRRDIPLVVVEPSVQAEMDFEDGPASSES